jgi:hypothetical protein
VVVCFGKIMALPIREGLLKALNCGILCRRNYRCNVIGDEQVKKLYNVSKNKINACVVHNYVM